MLNKNYQDYFSDQNFKYRNFVFEGNTDKLSALAQLLNHHEIKSYRLQKNSTVKGYDYQKQKVTNTFFF